MKVLCTGISGVGKAKYLETIKHWIESSAPNTDGKTHTACIFDSGEYIRAAGRDLRIEVTDKKVLDLSNIDELRAIAFERICCELEKQQWDRSRHALISTHACFRWNKFIRTAFDAHYLKRLSVDCYVNIYDNASAILDGQRQSDQWRGRLELPEIITWRDEELFLTEIFSHFDDKPFYLVAKAEPPETLGRLVIDPDCQKIYLSYPISAIQRTNPEFLDEVVRYAEKLRQKYVVFNPPNLWSGTRTSLFA